MTHSSARTEYAVQSLPAAVQSQTPRLCAPGRGPPERYSTRYMCFVSAPPQRGPASAEEALEAALDALGRGPAERSQEGYVSEVSGRSVPGRLLAVLLQYIAIVSRFWPPRPQYRCCRSRPEGRRGGSSGAETHGWRRASLLQHLVLEVPPTMLERLISSEYA